MSLYSLYISFQSWKSSRLNAPLGDFILRLSLSGCLQALTSHGSSGKLNPRKNSSLLGERMHPEPLSTLILAALGFPGSHKATVFLRGMAWFWFWIQGPTLQFISQQFWSSISWLVDWGMRQFTVQGYPWRANKTPGKTHSSETFQHFLCTGPFNTSFQCVNIRHAHWKHSKIQVTGWTNRPINKWGKWKEGEGKGLGRVVGPWVMLRSFGVFYGCWRTTRSFWEG